MNVDNKYVNGFIRKQIKKNLKKVKKKKNTKIILYKVVLLESGLFLAKIFCNP